MLFYNQKDRKRVWIKANYISVCLTTLLPLFASADALQRYTIPQQSSVERVETRQGVVDEAVYLRFEERINGLSVGQINNLINQYDAKRSKAVKESNINAVSHYTRLINILKQHRQK